MRGIAATLIIATSAWAAPATLATAGGDADAAGSRAASGTYEARILHWSNVQRRAHGVRPLRAASCVDRVAESWSRRLAGTTSFYHQGLSPLRRSCQARRVGENMAWGNRSARSTVAMWMHSPRHRRNLLNGSFTRLGVGAYYSPGGRMYTVQDFAG